MGANDRGPASNDALLLSALGGMRAARSFIGALQLNTSTLAGSFAFIPMTVFAP
jgi:hypothetical protein